MGLTHVTTRVSPLTGSRRSFEDEFLVDTGAIDCLVPASRLKKIGVKEEGRDVYELASGDTVEYPFGFVRVRAAPASPGLHFAPTCVPVSTRS